MSDWIVIRIPPDDPNNIEDYKLTKEDEALLEKGKIKDHLIVAALKELLKTT